MHIWHCQVAYYTSIVPLYLGYIIVILIYLNLIVERFIRVLFRSTFSLKGPTIIRAVVDILLIQKSLFEVKEYLTLGIWIMRQFLSLIHLRFFLAIVRMLFPYAIIEFRLPTFAHLDWRLTFPLHWCKQFKALLIWILFSGQLFLFL